MLISANDADSLYQQAISRLMDAPESSPRDMKTRERLGVQLRLHDPMRNVVTLGGRRLNYQFLVAEFLWMATGQNRVDLIQPFNRNIVMAADEDVPTFQGAYGPRINDQLGYVVQKLLDDPDTRQAVLTIWRDRPAPTRDVPCTVAMQFLLRDGRLVMVTTMRSNDVWLGLPYDLFNFTQMQKLVAHYVGADAGEYIHNVGSFHLYERNVKRAREVLNGNKPRSVMVPGFSDAPLGLISAAYTELATLGGRKGFDVQGWYYKWEEALFYSEPWCTFLLTLARRFDEGAPRRAGTLSEL